MKFHFNSQPKLQSKLFSLNQVCTVIPAELPKTFSFPMDLYL